jgi:response regulator RpfG family c-di-GMP phosphodiesterase
LEVLQALDQKVYDLLFLDVQMPEMDGLEAARQICERWSPERRPAVIAMTGNALMGDRERCLSAGMDDYISKPVRVGEIQAAIERWGPLKTTPFDTQILLRTKAASSSELLDEAILARLRAAALDEAAPERALVLKFLEGGPQQLAQLAKSREDSANLLVAVQQLKNLSLQVGAKRMVAVCEQLEQPGAAEAPQRVFPLIQELRAAFALTRTQLLPLVSPPSMEAGL